MDTYRRISDKWKKYFLRNSILILLFLVLITVISRFSISYALPSQRIVPPESVFSLSGIGADLETGVIKPTFDLLKGHRFYDTTSSYGSAVYITASPLFTYLINQNICSLPITPGCHNILYSSLLLITSAVFVLFCVKLYIKLMQTDRVLFLILIILFLIQVPVAIGLERGNLDILLASLIGFLYIISVPKRTSGGGFRRKLYAVLIGFVGGYLANAKLFLLPFALSSLIVSNEIMLGSLSFVITFVGFAYLPIIYGVSTNFFDLISTVLYWQKSADSFFAVPSYLIFNHSFSAISTLFTNCVGKPSCFGYNAITDFIRSFVTKLLMFFVFVVPFLSRGLVSKILHWCITQLNFIRDRKIVNLIDCIQRFITGSIKIIYNILRVRNNASILTFLYILSAAVINLVPQNSYSYRLLYSIPLIFIFIKSTDHNNYQRFLLLMSVFWLSLNGLWLFFRVVPDGWSLADARVMSLFVVLHYFFFIKLSQSVLKKRSCN